MKSMAEKEEKKDSETKDDRPTCLLCGQHVDKEVLEKQKVEVHLPIPKGQWALLTAKQAAINDCDVESEKVKLQVMKRTNEFAKAHRIGFMVGLGIEIEPPRTYGEEEGDPMTGPDHQYEFFHIDTVTGKKYYLGVKLDDKEQGVIYDLWWEYSAKNELSQEASMDYFETMTEVAKALGWGFRPLRVDQGKFVAASWIDEQVKNAREEGKKECPKPKD